MASPDEDEVAHWLGSVGAGPDRPALPGAIETACQKKESATF